MARHAVLLTLSPAQRQQVLAATNTYCSRQTRNYKQQTACIRIVKRERQFVLTFI
jgi:hypothetical protein